MARSKVTRNKTIGKTCESKTFPLHCTKKKAFNVPFHLDYEKCSDCKDNMDGKKSHTYRKEIKHERETLFKKKQAMNGNHK